MKKIFSLIIILLAFNITCSAQDIKAYNYFTFYYVDNSDGPDADPLNEEMVQELKDNLTKLSMRPDNYFFFYGCNGEESKKANNLTSFNSSATLKKYLSNASRESDFSYDKKEIREYLTEYPVRIKQTAELNIYLSTYAAQRIAKEIEDLPTPLVFMKELPMYLNSNDLKSLKVKLNIYINKEAIDDKAFTEEKLKSYFDFCIQQLKLDNYQTEIKFL